VFKIPEDVEIELQKKFNNVHVPTVIQYLFHAILTKVLKDGSCSVREFGKFIAYRTKSGKIGKDVVRFKFKISNTLNTKLKLDKYLLENVPIRAQNIFTEDHEQKIKEKQQIKTSNVIAQQSAEKYGKERTKSNIATNEILELLNNITEKE
jgi:nucleoid DNA-binding protein